MSAPQEHFPTTSARPTASENAQDQDFEGVASLLADSTRSQRALVSIIIVTFNSRRWLARQTAALAALTERRFEVIVWDNASSPQERPSAADLAPGARLIQCEDNVGFAEANNRAAALAQGDLLAFLNPDAFPAPQWLEALLEAARRYPKAAAFGATQWRADAPGVLDGAGDVMHACGIAFRGGYGHTTAPPVTGVCFAACGAALLVRREAFAAVGGFDGSYFCYFEDVDLCFRLRLKGHEVVQVREAEVDHVGGGSAGAQSAFGDFHGARNRLWTFAKNMPLPLLAALLLPHLAATVAVSFIHLLQGRGFAGFRGIGAGLAGLGPVLRARRVTQARPRASTRAIAQALAWSPLLLLTRRPLVRPLRPD